MGPVRDAITRNLPPCPKCKADRGDPCRLPSWRTCKPHKARERLWVEMHDETGEVPEKGPEDLRDLSKEERSLLLYFETCAVDNYGAVDSRRMNRKDFAIVKRWASKGFVGFGRVVMASIREGRTHWVELSGRAWLLAHEERRARAERMAGKRPYEKTSD